MPSPTLATLNALRLEFADDALLVLRQQLRPDLDAELLADRRRSTHVVAGQHDDLDAGIGQGIETGTCIGPRFIPHGDNAANVRIPTSRTDTVLPSSFRAVIRAV